MIKILITELTKALIAEAIHAHPAGKYTLGGAYTLAEWLDESCPTLAIFCVEDIYREWEEFPSAIKAAESWGWQFDGLEEDKSDSAWGWLQNQTTVLDVESVNIIRGRSTIFPLDLVVGGRVIVRSFYI